jgi:hypothetical protein
MDVKKRQEGPLLFGEVCDRRRGMKDVPQRRKEEEYKYTNEIISSLLYSCSVAIETQRTLPVSLSG